MGRVSINGNKNKSQLVRKTEDPITIELIKEVPVIQVEYVHVPVEVKVPEYITVIREERIEVPVMQYIEVPVEKIVEIPKIQVVEKPYEVIKEIYDIKPVLREKAAHERTKRKLKTAYGFMAVLLIITYINIL